QQCKRVTRPHRVCLPSFKGLVADWMRGRFRPTTPKSSLPRCPQCRHQGWPSTPYPTSLSSAHGGPSPYRRLAVFWVSCDLWRPQVSRIMASRPESNRKIDNPMAKEPRDKIGPLPEDAFENDAISNPEPDTSPGSTYDRLKQMLDERDKNKPKK